MSATTKQLALCGVMTALGVVLVCLGGLVPPALYICPMLASMVLVLAGSIALNVWLGPVS